MSNITFVIPSVHEVKDKIDQLLIDSLLPVVKSLNVFDGQKIKVVGHDGVSHIGYYSHCEPQIYSIHFRFHLCMYLYKVKGNGSRSFRHFTVIDPISIELYDEPN